MLDYLDSPYIIAVSTVVGAVLVLLLLTFLPSGTSDGKGSRFVLPCMINPATLESEDEDEQSPPEDISKSKGEVIVSKEANPKLDENPLMGDLMDKDSGILKVNQSKNSVDIEACVKTATEAEQKIKLSLSKEELQNERKIQQQQLAAIFALMQDQTEIFGTPSMDDIEVQMKLYR